MKKFKFIIAAAAAVLLLSGCPSPYQEWVFYKGKWYTKQEYKALPENQTTLTITVQ